ncbi:MAG: bifunctional (p)ppGpp synthetase/guanosine-3',5'-bis(diphosphate) 3'-pyrophosphohydrolase [Patescibacteria group bacterium]|nr:HD domain-containing protein [Patescibacteria group bacterium]MDE1943883.1 bifunctional (p)ppGpp synthetase/guanosine-3',5'-bis(diphosphate) 3'-pyrophosphohydrolase [Patescibacteria group bacterium]MDE1944961.1 bifunctional (p)ppGpp synthetase/guanosine-3',5'-bis(diphosphate) 3'-pyrophosphohydrolase [Patescibacteria group bacterium]MDE2057988.1 bifunctional (p)ppGpp synthetase/guanosine-3',5'-bis(diphosphate) 3'-pyrophosphohydrolase [Patescibacteria group bacterium]
MNHTPQTKQAIQFAARKHNGHFRAETEPLPYITHLFSVALLVAEDGAEDDVVSAALLHDTLEDTETTREELVEHFNERVAELVEHVSEVKERDGKKLDWKERKAAYLAHLEEAPDDALLIAIADKIDNIESKLEALAQEGKALLARWKRPQEDYLWYHGEAARIASARLPEHRLTKRLGEAHARERAILGAP